MLLGALAQRRRPVAAPETIGGYRAIAQSQAVLDLTTAATLKVLKVTPRQLVSVDWSAGQTTGREPVTQAIARAA